MFVSSDGCCEQAGDCHDDPKVRRHLRADGFVPKGFAKGLAKDFANGSVNCQVCCLEWTNV